MSPRGERSVCVIAPVEGMNTVRHYSGQEIQAFIDGNCDLAERAAFERHIQACSHCSRNHDALVHFEELVAEALRNPMAEIPEATARASSFERLLSSSAVPSGIVELRRIPFVQWPDYVTAHPEVGSESVIRELVEAAIVE